MAVDLQFVVDMIKLHETIQFGWSRKLDFISHTAIAILLDQKPVFTIDYGADEDKLPMANPITQLSITSASKVSSSIGINLWKGQKSQVQDILLTALNHDTAIQVVKILYKMLLGDYNLFGNNCRDYVIKAVETLQELADSDDNLKMDAHALDSFHKNIASVRGEDKLKTIATGASAVMALGAVASAAVSTFKAYFAGDENDEASSTESTKSSDKEQCKNESDCSLHQDQSVCLTKV